MKLTDLDCKNAKPQEKKYKLSDGGGLYLEVRPNGAGTFGCATATTAKTKT